MVIAPLLTLTENRNRKRTTMTEDPIVYHLLVNLRHSTKTYSPIF
jgi:hypothetical protein